MTVRTYQSLFFVPTPASQLLSQQPWRDLGGQIQTKQPPAMPMRRAAAMAAATGLCLVLVPPAQLTTFRNMGGQVQAVQPPAKPVKRAGMIAATGESMVFQPRTQVLFGNPWRDIGGQTQAWQSPHPRWKRAGAIMPDDDGIGKPFVPPTPTFVLFDQTDADLPHPTASRLGALLRGDDGTQAKFVAPPAWGWETQWPTLSQFAALKKRAEAVEGNVQFAFFDPFVAWAWEQAQALPIKLQPRRAAALVGATYPDAKLVVTTTFANWDWQQTNAQPLVPRPRRGGILRGDDGIQTAFVPPPAWGWDVQPPQVAAKPDGRRKAGSAIRQRVVFGFFSPFVDHGFVVQDPQPPHPWVHKRGAIARGDDGTQGIFSGTTPLLTATYPWHEEPWVYPRRKSERAAAVMRGDDGNQDTLRRWFNAGWEIQPVQPPHPRREPWGALARGHDGNEAIFAGTPVLLTASFAWGYDGPFVFTKRYAKAAEAMLLEGDDGIAAPQINWRNAGWEVQNVQPPHPRVEKSAALMIGEDGIDKPFVPPFTVVVWFQSETPYQRRVKLGSVLAIGDQGIPALTVWRNAGWEIQSPQPPHRRPEIKAASFLRGDDGTQARLIRWFNAGWEVQPYQPPHIFVSRRGLFLRGSDGIDDRFVFNPSTSGPLRHVSVHGAITDSQPGIAQASLPASHSSEQIIVTSPTFHRVNVHGVTEEDS